MRKVAPKERWDLLFVQIDARLPRHDIMPAVDYRTPGGLSWEEFRTILDVMLCSDHVVGLEVTIYNPNLDADGTASKTSPIPS